MYAGLGASNETVSLLLSKGASPNLMDNGNHTVIKEIKKFFVLHLYVGLFDSVYLLSVV